MPAEDLAHLDALQPVDAAGDVGGAVGDLEEQQADPHGDHQPGELTAAQQQKAAEIAGRPGDHPGRQQAAQRLPPAVGRQQTRRVGAQAEEGGVSQGHDPPVAEDQVEADGRDGIKSVLGAVAGQFDRSEVVQLEVPAVGWFGPRAARAVEAFHAKLTTTGTYTLKAELAGDEPMVGADDLPGQADAVIRAAAPIDEATAREAAAGLGLTIEVATVTNSGEVQQAADSLDVDAFYVPTDNTVVSALESLLQVAESKSLPVIDAEGDSVERGAAATFGLDYEALGYQTGEMAVRVLQDGADPAEMPVETQTELLLIVNPAAAERMGVEIPAEVLDRADTWVPHVHVLVTGRARADAAQDSGTENVRRNRLSAVILFIVAITLHNVPEGLAVGVGFGASDSAVPPARHNPSSPTRRARSPATQALEENQSRTPTARRPAVSPPREARRRKPHIKREDPTSRGIIARRRDKKSPES